MALKQTVVRAFQSDEQGYVSATLNVSESVRNVTVNDTGDAYSQGVEYRELDCLEFSFDCLGGKKIDYLVFNLSISPDIIEKKRLGSKVVNIYNKYTTVLLKLEFITEKELSDMKKANYKGGEFDHILAELLAIRDKPVRFKPIRVKDKTKRREYDSIDWLSLELIESDLTKESNEPAKSVSAKPRKAKPAKQAVESETV